MFTLAKDTKLEITLKIDGTLLALGTVVTCDPNVGNGIKFTKILPEDQEELRRYFRDTLLLLIAKGSVKDHVVVRVGTKNAVPGVSPSCFRE
jgi:hypothetical protein